MMMNNISISDIHKIRSDNYEQTKELSSEELLKKTKQQASVGWKHIAKIRNEQSINISQ